MQLNTLIRTNKNKRTVRIGRGHTRGKTSGRGHKGQKARAGHHIRPAIRDMIKRIPKLRGHGKNRARTVNQSNIKPEVINLTTLSTHFENGTKITPNLLLAKHLVRRHGGRTPEVKILGHGTLDKKLVISKCLVSVSARDAITKAGGEIL
jgi:large subunit ribosomal protein L15